MLLRTIPSSGESLPVVGIGTWQQFDVHTSSSDELSVLSEVLKTLLKQGGKLIDSSPMYGNAEKIVGVLTKDPAMSDQFFYATKVWISGKEEGIKQMEDSFQKMGRKVMDLMQVHNLVDWRTHLKTLNEWKAAGKVRYTGITHYTASAHADLEQIIKKEKVDFVQLNYSINVRNAEKSLLPTAMDRGVAVIVNEPLDKGALFRLTRGRKLPGWASEYNIDSWGQFFLKYIIAHPAITCIIPGTSDPQHMADNIEAGIGPLPDERTRMRMIETIEHL